MAQYVIYLNTAGEAFMNARRVEGESVAKTISRFIKESVEKESIQFESVGKKPYGMSESVVNLATMIRRDGK